MMNEHKRITQLVEWLLDAVGPEMLCLYIIYIRRIEEQQQRYLEIKESIE